MDLGSGRKFAVACAVILLMGRESGGCSDPWAIVVGNNGSGSSVAAAAVPARDGRGRGGDAALVRCFGRRVGRSGLLAGISRRLRARGPAAYTGHRVAPCR